MNAPDKKALRARMLRARGDLSPEEQRRLSREAARNLLKDAAWQNAGVVALYMAVRGEADPALLLYAALATGKTVLLPVCRPEKNDGMILAPCSDPACLRPGPFGIPEPPVLEPSVPESPGSEPAGAATDAPPPDLALLPGLAFDRRGARLGMGGGYYDRLLALPEYEHTRRIGFGYSFQVVDALERETWDIPVHAVCTEQGLLWIHRI